MKDGKGRWISDEEEMGNEAVNFLSKIWSSEGSVIDENLIDVIPSLFNEADNHFMTAIPSLEELKETVFDMSGDSAPGLDGFSGSFYQAFWDII